MGEKNWKGMFGSIWMREGNVFIQFLLDAGLDVNALNKFGKTMMSYAAEYGILEIAEFLVQKDADATVVNTDGSNPLHIAARYGCRDIVKFFVHIGIAVDSCDNEKCTPLHYLAAETVNPSAGRESYKEIVHILVDRNADLNAVNRKGSTPLLLAAQSSRKHMVELFVQLGADLECCDVDQWTVLHHACAQGLSGIVRILVEGRFEIDLNTKSLAGNAPVLIAALFSHEDIVKFLVESGADVECKDYQDKTLLHFSCGKGWLYIVKSLESKGCDLNAKDSQGRTPLFWAAVNLHLSVVEYLVKCGADLEIWDKSGWTVLHYACRSGWLEVVKSLTKSGSDINAPNINRNTPLHLASEQYNVEIVKHLLKAGAYFNVVNDNGKTAFNMFVEKFRLEEIIIFLGKGAYFQIVDYTIIRNNRMMKAGILQNIQLCTVALINKFNNVDLSKIYEIPVICQILPSIENLKIARRSLVAQQIAENVKYEIQTKGYCNILNVHPIMLNRLCVLTLVKRYCS